MVPHGSLQWYPAKEARPGYRWGGGGGGSLHHWLHISVVWPLTRHPFRDGAPFLLQIDTSNIWALDTLFPYVTNKPFAYPIPVLFCRLQPPSFPRIAIVFSLPSINSLQNSSMSNASNFLISSTDASCSSFYISHSPT